MTDNFFVVILGLMGHNRMGKTCAPKMFGFLRHPNAHPKQWYVEERRGSGSHVLKCLMFSVWGLEASPVAWTSFTNA
jgi:hypothetical protein